MVINNIALRKMGEASMRGIVIFTIGIIMVILAIILLVISFIYQKTTGKRIQKQLKDEYSSD